MRRPALLPITDPPWPTLRARLPPRTPPRGPCRKGPPRLRQPTRRGNATAPTRVRGWGTGAPPNRGAALGRRRALPSPRGRDLWGGWGRKGKGSWGKGLRRSEPPAPGTFFGGWGGKPPACSEEDWAGVGQQQQQPPAREGPALPCPPRRAHSPERRGGAAPLHRGLRRGCWREGKEGVRRGGLPGTGAAGVTRPHLSARLRAPVRAWRLLRAGQPMGGRCAAQPPRRRCPPGGGRVLSRRGEAPPLELQCAPRDPPAPRRPSPPHQFAGVRLERLLCRAPPARQPPPPAKTSQHDYQQGSDFFWGGHF